ncbi:MAG: DUF2208 family protein [Candidatus Methanomethylicia archaeon]
MNESETSKELSDEEKPEEIEKVLYETNAVELSNNDKNYRRLRAIGLLSFYFTLAFILFLFIDVLAMIVVFVVMWFSPYPFIPTFSIYKITDRAVIDNKGRRLDITPEYRFFTNLKHSYVGLKKGRRSVLWLYTNEPDKVINILENVSKLCYERMLKEREETEEMLEGREETSKEEVEKAGMQVAMEFEKSQGREPEDVSKENLGFDIISKGRNEIRYIEVKARADIGSITLTPNEWSKAKRFKEQYWLYVVFNATKKPELIIINNPAKKLKYEGIFKPTMVLISPDELVNKGKKI